MIVRCFLAILCILFVSFLSNDLDIGSIVHAQLSDCNIVTEIPVAECEALVDLYNSTGGSSWIENTVWLETDAPCTWYGVICENGNVTEILLDSNGLAGTIPTTLEDLSELNYLNLRLNQLAGSIPPELGNIINLQYLNLSDNRLDGNIPDTLGNLAQLVELQLYSNQLTGSMPAELGNLVNLQTLHLGNNKLTGAMPSQFGNLSQLQSLGASDNQLSGPLPSEIGQLSLHNLRLRNNQFFSEIPVEWNLLASTLNILRLDNNRLYGEIPFWITFSSPSKLTLNFNSLVASDPTVITFLETENPGWEATQTVVVENLHASNISQTTIELVWDPILYTGDGGLYEIWYGNADGTNMVSEMTSDKSVGTHLLTGLNPGQTYSIFVNTHTPPHGEQQNDLLVDGSLQAIEVTTAATFACTQVSEIPQAECEALEALYTNTVGSSWTTNTGWLENNMPCTWFGVTCNSGHVTQLVLSSNNLVGTIPTTLDQLTHLDKLWLNVNRLSGPLPSTLGNLSNLNELGHRQ